MYCGLFWILEVIYFIFGIYLLREFIKLLGLSEVNSKRSYYSWFKFQSKILLFSFFELVGLIVFEMFVVVCYVLQFLVDFYRSIIYKVSLQQK